MKERGARAMLLSFCAAALCCLLFAGAPRLIGGGERENAPEPRSRDAVACLTAPSQSEAPRCDSREDAPPRQGEAAVCPARLTVYAPEGVSRDANGNVLGARSYVRAVYRAFSLGDGFV